jgi:hypothetical protein
MIFLAFLFRLDFVHFLLLFSGPTLLEFFELFQMEKDLTQYLRAESYTVAGGT